MKRYKIVIYTLLLLFAVGQSATVVVMRMKMPVVAGTDIAFEEVQETVGERAEASEPKYPDLTGIIYISEIMPKNKTTIRDDTGDYTSWVEICNMGGTEISLKGWYLQCKSKKLNLDDYTIGAEGRVVVFVPISNSGTDNADLAAFTLKTGSEVKLRDPEDRNIFQVQIPKGMRKNYSLNISADGGTEINPWVTPGYPNDFTSFCTIQETMNSSELCINEVVTHNIGSYDDKLYGTCDWVELKNNASSPVLLSDYYVADSLNEEKATRLPNEVLNPGELFFFLCTNKEPMRKGSTSVFVAEFGLKSDNDNLYLFSKNGLVDCVSLCEIPAGGSYGRAGDGNGFRYFTEPTPGKENSGGAIAVTKEPAVSLPSGMYPSGEVLNVELFGEGVIRYTTDSSAPTEESQEYTGPITIREDTVIRACAFTEGCLPSRSITANYLIGKKHTLPVVCVNTDSPRRLQYIYQAANKTERIPANITYLKEGDSFTTNCTLSMNGGTSLTQLAKKSMLIRFNGAYGVDELDYDLFGDGRTGLTQLVIRAGQDYYNSMIRNELCQQLASEFSDNILTQRGKWCVLYLNGEYYGVYALKEDDDAHLYSDRYGVNKDSVTIARASVQEYSPIYPAIAYINSNNMRDSDNYTYLCDNLLDINSFVDWLVVEGWCANPDLLIGNLKYAASSEDDGKLRLVYYDLDAALSRTGFLFNNILNPAPDRRNQIYFVSTKLLQNNEFRDLLLRRTAEALKGALRDDHVLETIDRMFAEIEPEMQNECSRWRVHTYQEWIDEVDRLKNIISGGDGYHMLVINQLKSIMGLTEEQVYKYFEGLM